MNEIQSEAQSESASEALTRAVRALQDGAERLSRAVQLGAPTQMLREMSEPMADMPREMLVLMSPSDRRRVALIVLAADVRAFLKCLDDGWEGERLSAHARVIAQKTQEL